MEEPRLKACSAVKAKAARAFRLVPGRRVGLLNFALYDLARFGVAYRGSEAPLRDITNGDDWHYHAHSGYDQGTGLGVPDVANLLKFLR